MSIRRFCFGVLRPRGPAAHALAVTGLVAVCTSSVHAAEDRATLKLRGVIHKSVAVSLDPLTAAEAGHFAARHGAVRIGEETNYASQYRMYLEGPRAAALSRLTFDGRPVMIHADRALLESRGLGRDREVTARSRILAFADDGQDAASEPLFLVVRTH